MNFKEITKPHILIVDDREFDRILYREYLDEINFQFSELNDGENLVSFLSENSIDLILLDWQMPRMGGLESLKNLRMNQSFREIPVIIITGLKDENVLEEAFQYGAVDFINKPVTKVEIRSRVNATLSLQKAKVDLIKQTSELAELNSIIKEQKKSLEESLQIKSDLGEELQKSARLDIDEKNQKIRKSELELFQFKNALKSSINDLDKLIGRVKDSGEESTLQSDLRKLSRGLKLILDSQLSYHESQDILDSIDTSFKKALVTRFPKLTNLDLKHCAFIRLNMDNSDVANILNVEMKSLQMTRYRLKKKLGLDENTSLREFLMSL